MKTLTQFFIAVSIIMLYSNIPAQNKQTIKYEITFTKIPRSGSGPDITEIISGTVKGTGLSDLYIVIYAKAGGKWWVQPTTASPYTKITTGTWQNETHLGIQYAALLVKKSYKPNNTIVTLPQTDDNVLAIKIVDAAK